MQPVPITPEQLRAITPEQLRAALALRDLTDESAGPHAVQLVVAALESALASTWCVPVRRDHGPRIVTVAENYDRLRYTADALTRDRRYSRYAGDGRMLRSHTTARIPALLDGLAGEDIDEILLSVPGMCYRRDAIGRRHVGEPHQLDLWLVRRRGPALGEPDLVAMIGVVVGAVLPGLAWHTVHSPHPYTLAGREIDVRTGDAEVEIGECGLAHPEVLAGAGLPAQATGLAMGLGLDRLVMLAKGIDDIRLLRSADPRVAGQLLDLSLYRPVPGTPAARRDLSLAVADDLDPELLGDRVRELLGPDAGVVQEVAVLAETGYADLPAAARARMGVRPGQKNVLVRVLLGAPTRTLTSAEANSLRDRIYAGLHAGSIPLAAQAAAGTAGTAGGGVH